MMDGDYIGVTMGPDGVPVLTTKWGATRRAPVAFKMKPVHPDLDDDQPPF